MGVSTNGILAYGISFDEDEIQLEELGEYLGLESDTDEEEIVDELKKLGLELIVHCSGECPMYIIGHEVATAYRGYPEEITKKLDLIKGDKTAEKLHKIQKRFGGKWGLWLCSMWC